MAENNEKTPSPIPVRRPLTEEELDLAFAGPSISVNRSLITVGPPGVRIAFVEQGQSSAHFRAAVSMSHQEAIALKNLLVEMLLDIEGKIKEAEESGG